MSRDFSWSALDRRLARRRCLFVFSVGRSLRRLLRGVGLEEVPLELLLLLLRRGAERRLRSPWRSSGARVFASRRCACLPRVAACDSEGGDGGTSCRRVATCDFEVARLVPAAAPSRRPVGARRAGERPRASTARAGGSACRGGGGGGTVVAVSSGATARSCEVGARRRVLLSEAASPLCGVLLPACSGNRLSARCALQHTTAR